MVYGPAALRGISYKSLNSTVECEGVLVLQLR